MGGGVAELDSSVAGIGHVDNCLGRVGVDGLAAERVGIGRQGCGNNDRGGRGRRVVWRVESQVASVERGS